MITKTAPWDKKPKRVVILPQPRRMCALCGGNTCPRPADNIRVCMSCGSTEFREVFEDQIDDFRAELLAREPEQTIHAIASGIGCTAHIVPPGCDPVDWLAEPEPQADDAWSLPGYEYFGSPEWFDQIEEIEFETERDILRRRQEQILAIMKEEPITQDEANELIDELAEIQTRIE